MVSHLDHFSSHLAAGSHTGQLFRSIEEQISAAAAFLAAGLGRGERCVYAGSADLVLRMEQALAARGVSVVSQKSARRLVLIPDRNFFRPARGGADELVDFLQRTYDAALADGCAGLRLAGEPFAELVEGPEPQLLEYEARLDGFLQDKKMLALCQYADASVHAGRLSAVLRTHSDIIFSGSGCPQNPFYESAAVLLEHHPARQEMKREQRIRHVLSALSSGARGAREALPEAAQKLIEEREAELHQYMRVAAHDLKAPLRAVSSFARIVEHDYADRMDPAGREYLEEIRRGADHMARLVDDLSRLSRAVTQRPKFERNNLHVLAEEALARTSLKTPLGSAEFNVSGGLPEADCDREQMRQVLEILLDNAIKFSAQAKPHPRIEVGGARDADGVRFYVRDNGIGIDPEFQERIFGLFVRLHTENEYPGTGAGLHIAQRIVQGHGGRIWVESRAGQGTTFFVELPDRARGSSDATAAAGPQSVSAAPSK